MSWLSAFTPIRLLSKIYSEKVRPFDQQKIIMRIRLLFHFSLTLTIILVKSCHCSGESEEQNSFLYESGGKSFFHRHLMAENEEEEAQDGGVISDDE